MARPPALWLSLMVLAAGAPRAWGAEVDRYVPADATAVASIDVRRLLEAPLVRRHLVDRMRAGLREDAGLEGVLTAAGIDPLRDVRGVVLAVTGAKAEQCLVIVRGKFDVARARQAAEQLAREHPDRLKVHGEGSSVLFENRSVKRPYFVAFADGETAVAGLSGGAVAAAVRGGGRPAPLRPDMRALVAGADGTKTAWLVGLTPPELKKQLRANENTAALADRIESFSATLDVGRDLEAVVRVHTTDAKTAEGLAETLDGLRGVVKLLAQNRPEVADLLAQAVDGTRVGARQTTVEVRVRVGGEALDKALRKR